MYAALIAIAVLFNTAVCVANEESCSADEIEECPGQNLNVLSGKNMKSHIPLRSRPLFLKLRVRYTACYPSLLQSPAGKATYTTSPPVLQITRGVWGAAVVAMEM